MYDCAGDSFAVNPEKTLVVHLFIYSDVYTETLCLEEEVHGKEREDIIIYNI